MKIGRLLVISAALGCASAAAIPAEDLALVPSSQPADAAPMSPRSLAPEDLPAAPPVDPAAPQSPTTQPVDAVTATVPVVDSAEAEPAPKKNYFALDELSAELGVEGLAERRTVRTDTTGLMYFQPRYAQRNKTARLEETLGLTASGNIIDERTLLYDAMVRFGLSQEHYEETRQGPNDSSDPHGTLLEYDLHLRALPAGKISASAGASQLDDRLPRPFLPSLDRQREKYGVELSYNDAKLPMQLSYEHLFDKLSSGRRDLVDEEEQGEDTLRYEATWQPTDNHSLSLEFEHERRSDRYSGTTNRFDTTRNYFSLDDTIRFGPKHQSQFETLLRVEDESGDLARDVFEAAPRLRLQHTDDLLSYYKAQYLKQSYADLDTSTHRGDIGLTHTWRNMLTSTGGLYALQQNSDRGYDMDEWGALADFGFHKEHPGGTFSTTLSYLHSRSTTDDGRRGGIVVDEAGTFRDPLPIYLAQRNVNRLGILVRAAEGPAVFVEGLDYWVLQLGDVTSLSRNPLGRILNRQTVLISYTYRTFDDFKVDRDRIDLRIQDDLKLGLTPYYALNYQDERIDSQRYLTFADRNINRHRVGFSYRQPRWSVGPEYEYNDDSIDPYQAGHLNADAILLQSAPHSLNADLRTSYFDFRGNGWLEHHFSTLLDAGLTHRYVLGERLETGTTAKFRFENDSLFGETVGVDLRASLSYRIGEFSLLVEAEYDMLDLPTSTDNSAGIWFKIRRNIPIIGQRKGP